jgi:hypothetical protein
VVKRPAPRFRFIVGHLALTLVSLLVVFAVGEFAMRAYQRVSRGWPIFGARVLPATAWAVPDQRLGWRAPENRKFEVQTERGTETVSYDAQGFRVFGDISSQRPRILVIGDSFTQASDAPDGYPYYVVLGKLLEAEVFAHGTGGYGTLQESMILEGHVNSIRPDLIVLQLCSNDFANNDFDAEMQSSYPCDMFRPYLIGETIELRIPCRFAPLRRWAEEYSRLLFSILDRMDKAARRLDNFEQRVRKAGPTDPAMRSATAVTGRLLRRFRDLAGGVPVVAFDVESHEPWFGVFRGLCQEVGIEYLESPARAMVAAQKSGVNWRSRDGRHWNEVGHRIAGEALATEILSRRGQLRPRGR